jgi:hypothetical protein
MARVGYFVGGCVAYVCAWAPLCIVVSRVLAGGGAENRSAWENVTELGLPPGYVAQRAHAPPEIVGFFVFTVLLFSSFGAWHLTSWVWTDQSRWRWLPRVEIGYFGLSAVAKTTLHLFLVLTVLAQSTVGRDGQRPSSDGGGDDDTYAVGFGLTFGLIIPVVWGVTAWLARKTTPATTTGVLSSVPAGTLRWADYVVSAPVMFAVLAVSWGCTSAAVVGVGSALQAVGIMCARASDPLMEVGSTSAVGHYHAARLHTFLAAVHLSSVIVFLMMAARRDVLGLTVPLRSTWSVEPFAWYRVKRVATGLEGGLMMDTAGATHEFPVVLLAAFFATWSGGCHVYGAAYARGALRAAAAAAAAPARTKFVWGK